MALFTVIKYVKCILLCSPGILLETFLQTFMTSIIEIYCDKSCCWSRNKYSAHDDVINWKRFSRYWPSVRETTGHRWIPLTKASEAELWCFLWSASEQMVDQTSETPVIWDLHSLWRHCNLRKQWKHRSLWENNQHCICEWASLGKFRKFNLIDTIACFNLIYHRNEILLPPTP